MSNGEIIVLKARTFDIIMTKQRLVEQLQAIDSTINENIREIQKLEFKEEQKFKNLPKENPEKN